MHKWKRQPEKTKLEDALDELFSEMKSYAGYDEDYAKTADQVVKLYALKEHDNSKRLDPNTMAIVGGNLAIALIVIGFEQKHVVTTKVLNFLTKLR